MPSVIRSLTHSWFPKGSGEKGPGRFSNSNSHDAEVNYLKDLTSFVVRKGAWATAWGNTVYGNSGGNRSSSMVIFNFYTGVSQTPTSKLVAHQSTAQKVRNITDGVDVRTGIGGFTRMVFASVKNRLFMSNGTGLPAITPDATAGNYYSWGVNPPVANLTYTIGTVFAGTATVTVGPGTTLTWNTGQKFPAFSPSLNGIMPITINGVNGFITSWTSPTSMQVSGAWGVGGPWAFSMGQTVFTGTANLLNANPLVTWVAGPDTFAGVSVNQPIWFSQTAGGTVTIGAGYVYTIGSLALPNINIAPAWTPGNLAGATWRVNAGPLNWSGMPGGYQYSYYYYDSVTGHCSSESPVLEVADGPPAGQGVTVNIGNIVTTGDGRFTRIILCRSSLGGSDRQPLASLPNTGGPLSYIDNLTDDSRRGTDIYVGTPQPGPLNAPRKNTPPPSDLNHATYWDGRFWGSSNTQIGILFFSARNDSEVTGEISVGVGEESWPLEYSRSIPGSDGRITGLRVVGRNLFVLTDLSIYQVVGASPDTYALYKVTSSGAGTSHFATCEIPGTDINAGGDVLAYMGNDRRLHFLFANSGDYPQSYPIQDALDYVFGLFPAFAPSTLTQLNVMHTSDGTYLVAQINIVNTDLGIVMFDLDRKLWYFLSAVDYPCACLVEGLLGGTLMAMAGTWTSNNVYRFMDPASLTRPAAAQIGTYLVSPPGLDRKQMKDLQSLTVYTNEPAALDHVSVSVDNDPLSVDLVRVDTADSRIATLYAGDEGELGIYAHLYVPQGRLIRGRVMRWFINYAPTVVDSQIREVRALYTYEDATENAGNV